MRRRGIDSVRPAIRRPRGVAVAAICSAIFAVIIEPVPAHAATIPTPPAICHPIRGHPKILDMTMTPPGDWAHGASDPGEVDVRDGPDTVTFTVQTLATGGDTIDGVEIDMQSPRGRHLTALLSQSPDPGVWTGSATIPRYSAEGDWLVLSMDVTDTGGGRTDYLSDEPEWQESEWPEGFNVRSIPDVKAPVLTLLKVSKTSVNTTHAVHKVTITAKATDNLAGVKRVSITASVVVHGHDLSAVATLVKKSGTSRNGTFTGTMVLPQGAGSGKHAWSLKASIGDNAGNVHHYGPKALKAKHFASTVSVTSTNDTSNPVLTGLSLPLTVDTHAGAVRVGISVAASDTGSGVQEILLAWVPPSGSVNNAGTMKLISGKPISGIWHGSFTIPQCTEPGPWGIFLRLDDGFHQKDLSPGALAAQHFRNSIDVTALDATNPKVSVPSIVTTTGSIVLTFSEPTLWSRPANQTFSVLKATTATNLTGTWTCKNASSTAVTCDADGANVVTATFKPSAALKHGQQVTLSTGYPSGVYDTSGNPMLPVSLSVAAT